MAIFQTWILLIHEQRTSLPGHNQQGPKSPRTHPTQFNSDPTPPISRIPQKALTLQQHHLHSQGPTREIESADSHPNPGVSYQEARTGQGLDLAVVSGGQRGRKIGADQS